MDLYLVGDIGGTNARIATVKITDLGAVDVVFKRTYSSAAYASFIDILEEFFHDAGLKRSEIASVCFAVAGPIVAGTVKFTNLSWQLSEKIIQDFIGRDEVRLLNDFAAIAYGLEFLSADDLQVINDAPMQKGSMRSVIGAGTGLGYAHIYYANGRPLVQNTEAGHIDFAPVGELQIKLLQYLEGNLSRVSIERVLSGYGIVNIYNFLAETEFAGAKQNKELRELLQLDIKHGARHIAGFVTKDEIAAKTFDMFMQVYAATIGNLALSMLPYGGLFVAGGIAPKQLDCFLTKSFKQKLYAKGRLSDLLHDIPMYVVKQPLVGIYGSAYVAQACKNHDLVC